MLISVVYQNNETGMVEAYLLDELISSKKIKKFLRSEGWVTIGIDPTRKVARSYCDGVEKSSQVNKAVKGRVNR
jgi:hypothetical protein